MNPKLHPKRLLTIVCEAEIERTLLVRLHQLGIRGYTITEARGQGEHGDRDALWPSSANIRIEILGDAQVLDAALDMLADNYFASYGLVAFVSDVGVLRPGKFR